MKEPKFAMKILLRESIEIKSPRIVVCASCQAIVPRQSRQQRFCSPRCKSRGRTRVLGLRVSAPPKNVNDFNGGFGAKIEGRGVIGPADVIAVELWDRHSWEPAVSSDETRIEISRLRTRALVS